MMLENKKAFEDVFFYAQIGIQTEINRLNHLLLERKAMKPTKIRKQIQRLKKLQLTYKRTVATTSSNKESVA